MDKREDSSISMANLTFSDENPASSFALSSIFDMSCEGDKWGSNSFGFMDLLNFHNKDFGVASLFDSLQKSPPILPPPSSPPPQPLPSPASTVPESSEVLNNPPTPPSISSSSNEAENNNEEQTNSIKAGDDEEQDQDKTKKQLKQKNQKRQTEPRVAFMTKSDLDNLDDGYRWRKYGQKAVKNSPHPRSYYRCTTAGCGVKKRVERSSEDPTIVITTYEGQHTHPSPITPRRNTDHNSIAFAAAANAASPFFNIPQPEYLQLHHQQQQPYTYTTSPSLNLNSGTAVTASFNPSFSSFIHQERSVVRPPPASLLRDHGLLQDIVPSEMRNEQKEY